MDNKYLYSKSNQVTLYKGYNINVLKTLPDESINCVVTSPPYYALRDYGSDTWMGGDENCDHKSKVAKRGVGYLQDSMNKGMGVDFYTACPNCGAEKMAEWIGGNDINCKHEVGRSTRGGLTEMQLNNTGSFGDEAIKNGHVCPHCHAVRKDNQLGLESTPQEFVKNLVDVFKEIKRVLVKDGTLWLNLGDSYAGSNGNGYKQTVASQNSSNAGGVNESFRDKFKRQDDGYKPKDLMGIPWKVAFALQEDGWYLRQDIIWHKPAPMPESVKDRCTKSHEYIFLLSKSSKYYYDADAIKEPSVDAESFIGRRERNPNSEEYKKTTLREYNVDPNITGKTYPFRNKRSVWSIGTASYKGSHFAVFPKELPMNCIKAGTREGDVVLDPFAGSGTTLMVAQELGRKAIGIDVKAEYLDMCLERTKQMGLF